MNIAHFLMATMLLAVTARIACAAEHPSKPNIATAEDARPNILFIISDDQERQEFNFLPEGRDEQGKPRNLSPNLDRLAAEGVVFPNQYVTSPVCTPSRFTVLTGTYSSRSSSFEKTIKSNGQVNITWNCHIAPETPNLARTLQQAGYFTGAVGKNHVIEVKGPGRNEGPADDADPRDAVVAKYYSDKQQNSSMRLRTAVSTTHPTSTTAIFPDTLARHLNSTTWIGSRVVNNLFDDKAQQARVREMQQLLREAVAKVPGSFAEFRSE